MAEYIEREAAIEWLKRRRDSERFPKTKYAGLESAIFQIKHIPTADVAEVRHGEWVHTDLAAGWYGKDECSECQYHTAYRVDLSSLNYCPNCGSKMDGKGE